VLLLAASKKREGNEEVLSAEVVSVEKDVLEQPVGRLEIRKLRGSKSRRERGPRRNTPIRCLVSRVKSNLGSKWKVKWHNILGGESQGRITSQEESQMASEQDYLKGVVGGDNAG